RNHKRSPDGMTVPLTKACSSTVVNFEALPFVYRGPPRTTLFPYTTLFRSSQAVAAVYSGDCSNVTTAGGCTATGTFAGDQNHNIDSKATRVNSSHVATSTAVFC